MLDNSGGLRPPCTPRSCICTAPVIPYRICSCLLANGVSDLQYTPQMLCHVSEQFRGAAILLNCSSERLSSIQFFRATTSDWAAVSVPAEWHCQAETVAPSAVPMCWTRVLSRALARLYSRVLPSLLLQALLACWDQSAFYHTQQPLKKG